MGRLKSKGWCYVCLIVFILCNWISTASAQAEGGGVHHGGRGRNGNGGGGGGGGPGAGSDYNGGEYNGYEDYDYGEYDESKLTTSIWFTYRV